ELAEARPRLRRRNAEENEMSEQNRPRNPRPAAGQPARPGAQPARPAAQPARPAAQPARPVAQPARPAPAPVGRRPAPRVPEPVEEEAPAPVRRRVSRGDGPPPEEGLDATTKKGMIVAGLVLLIGGVVWIVASNKREAVKTEEDDYKKGKAAF